MSKEEHIKLPNKYEGFLFRPPAGREPLGCLIVFHERYGLVPHTLNVCRRLAENGYLVLAPDLFSLWEGDRAALHSGKVRVFLTDGECAAQLDQWIAYLKTTAPAAVTSKIALFGVCQSGRYPIVVASERKDIGACIIFYGAASERDWEISKDQPMAMPDMIAKLETPVLCVLAEEDHTISMPEMQRLRDTFEASDVTYRMRIVGKTPHGFLNETMPGRYREAESEQAWRDLFAFLDDVFVHGWPHGRIIWDFVSDKARDYDFTKNVRLE
jgi:carboxymethylenebutenolidase